MQSDLRSEIYLERALEIDSIRNFEIKIKITYNKRLDNKKLNQVCSARDLSKCLLNRSRHPKSLLSAGFSSAA